MQGGVFFEGGYDRFADECFGQLVCGGWSSRGDGGIGVGVEGGVWFWEVGREAEVELGEKGTGEVGICVATFEDDAVELVLGDGDGPVGFFDLARKLAVEEFGVENGDPFGAVFGAPVEKDEERAGGVVDVGIASVGPEDGFELVAGRKGEGVGVLDDFVTTDVFDGVG